MTQFETALYLGQEGESGYAGAEIEENFFIAFFVAEGATQKEGRAFLHYLKEVLLDPAIVGLLDIENKVSRAIKEKNPPAGFSLSLGYLKGNILYLKTVGSGQIIIKRKNKITTLLSGDNSASGYYKTDDVFIFTTSQFIDLVGGEEKLKSLFDHRSPHQIVDEVTPRLKAKGDNGAVAIFVHFVPLADVASGTVEESETIIASKNFLERAKESLGAYYARFGRRRILTGVTVFILFFIFLWSVILGYERRNNIKATEKIKLAREFINQKLAEAKDTAFFNMDSALASIAESRQKLNEVKIAYPKRSEISELEKLIAQTEEKILKKEEAKSSEFYDLALDNEKASGDRLYLEGGALFVLDKGAGSIYKLSLEKKSLDKTASSDLKKATLIASWEGKKYFYIPSQGIYTFDNNNKVQKVVGEDKDWGVVKDMSAFNANLYLMDTGKDKIYKYPGGEDGFGAKTSYFASGQATDLSFAENFVIDGSIYIGGGKSIIKFTSGLRDGFTVNLPVENFNINKVFTSKDLESVYAWDKKAGTVYVMDKGGEFKRQVKSAALAQATDLVVYKDKIFTLIKNKIFLIE